MKTKLRKMGVLAICIAIAVLVIGINSSVAQKEDVQVNAAPTDGRTATKGQQSNTYYEAVENIGFNPQTRVLDGVTSVRQNTGFAGFEFVSFWVDWNNNNIFEASEYAGTGIAYIPNPVSGTSPTAPLMYSISTPVSPPPTITPGSVRKVRAILSWATPPTGPTYNPVWGNIIDKRIRFDPIE